MTHVNSVLWAFFSPFSIEQLWVMGPRDDYTLIVRNWAAVQSSLDQIKLDLTKNCATWAANYKDNPSWKPTKTSSRRKNAFWHHTASPKGTDPNTCKAALAATIAEQLASNIGTVPVVVPKFPKVGETILHTCAIGSYSIYTTAINVDCTKKTATLNYWMHNVMSKSSFGKFAHHPLFSASGMKDQFMYWNWSETVDWSSGKIRARPGPGSGPGGW